MRQTGLMVSKITPQEFAAPTLREAAPRNVTEHRG